MTISHDQLTLSNADGNEGINSLEPSEHGLGNKLTWDDSWSLDLCKGALAAVDGRASIDGLVNTMDNVSKELGSKGNVHNASPCT